jgi:hypothetical protein
LHSIMEWVLVASNLVNSLIITMQLIWKQVLWKQNASIYNVTISIPFNGFIGGRRFHHFYIELVEVILCWDFGTTSWLIPHIFIKIPGHIQSVGKIVSDRDLLKNCGHIYATPTISTTPLKAYFVVILGTPSTDEAFFI